MNQRQGHRFRAGSVSVEFQLGLQFTDHAFLPRFVVEQLVVQVLGNPGPPQSRFTACVNLPDSPSPSQSLQ